MVGDGFGLGVEIVSGPEGLQPVEARTVSKAVPKRVAEFAAGRRAARRALAEIGFHGVALPVGEDRAPLWPEGVTGSITHDAGIALAAVAQVGRAGSIGIDLTEAAPLPGGTRSQILRHPEEARLDELEARCVFSAKECLFKALSPDVGVVFGFSAAVVRPNFSDGTFEIRLAHALGHYEAGQSWQGRVTVAEGLLLTALALPPRAETRITSRMN